MKQNKIINLKEKMKETLYLIDGTALAYRSHYAFIRNPLTDSKGRPVSALNGVVNSFLKIVDQFEPAYIAIYLTVKDQLLGINWLKNIRYKDH